MTIDRSVTLYDGPGGPFEGMAVWDSAIMTPRPGVLLFPNVLGTKEADFLVAERLAALGYAVLVADVYGQGKRTARTDPDMGRYMMELNNDRALLRARLLASLEVLCEMGEVDAARVAAIGYCFGGRCVLDLARAGADVRGVVSLHGVYDPPPFPNAAITAKLLICHGWDDPLATPEVTVALAQELSAAGADWQLHAYGGTGHGFTDVAANMPERGLAYSPDADRRSWQAMTDFLAEVLQP